MTQQSEVQLTPEAVGQRGGASKGCIFPGVRTSSRAQCDGRPQASLATTPAPACENAGTFSPRSRWPKTILSRCIRPVRLKDMLCYVQADGVDLRSDPRRQYHPSGPPLWQQARGEAFSSSQPGPQPAIDEERLRDKMGGTSSPL